MSKTHYSDAQCCAITKAGRRCTGRWASALPITYGHNPDTGESVLAPHVVLCHRHRPWTEKVRRMERVPVVHGWLGAGNAYGYYYTVYREQTGSAPSPWFFERRATFRFGAQRSDAA